MPEYRRAYFSVSSYRATRNECRNMVGENRFIEIFVDTPLEICEQRDTKGMYAKARRGEIKGFTGIDDPYEEPLNTEIRLNTTNCFPDDNAHQIINYLMDRGFLLNSIGATGKTSSERFNPDLQS